MKNKILNLLFVNLLVLTLLTKVNVRADDTKNYLSYELKHTCETSACKIEIDIPNDNEVVITEVILPDGNTVSLDLYHFSYDVEYNGEYDFVVNYQYQDKYYSETISVNITELISGDSLDIEKMDENSSLDELGEVTLDLYKDDNTNKTMNDSSELVGSEDSIDDLNNQYLENDITGDGSLLSESQALGCEEDNAFNDISIDGVIDNQFLNNKENTYTVSTEEELDQAIIAIENSEESNATIVLQSNISFPDGFGGVSGKSVTVTSDQDNCFSLSLATDLVGDLILDKVSFSTYTIFANGHHFETTENAQGTIQSLYGGGSQGNDVVGDTSICLKGGNISASLFGGGYDSNVTGNVHIILDGANVVVNELYGGGRARITKNGRVNGDVTIDFRQGTTRDQFGGGKNEYSYLADERDPASISGTVTVNLGYEGAKTNLVYPGFAMYTRCGSYHSTVGNIRVNITDGVYLAEKNIMGCGYNDTVLGTVEMRIFGSPAIASAHIVGGGEGDATPSPLDNSGPIRILNQRNEKNALTIIYDVKNEEASGHGILAGSRYNDTEINGDILVELIDGNLDFIQMYDYVTETYGVISGIPKIIVRGGRAAQLFGDQHPDEAKKTVATLTDGNIEVGVLFSLGQVNVTNNAIVDIDSEKFDQYDGNIQKPFYNIDNLYIDGNSKLTTRNSTTQIYNDVNMNYGTWHAKGYTYIFEGMYTKNSNVFFDSYYQISYNHKKEPTEAVLCTSESDVFVAMKNKYRDAIHCSVDIKDSKWAILNPLQINGNVSLNNTLLQLPVVGDQETNNYPKRWIPLEINGLASGKALVEIVESANTNRDSTQWNAMLVTPLEGDNYIVGYAPEGTDTPNENKLPLQSVFELKNPDAVSQGLYLKRKEDADETVNDTYFMWQVARGGLKINHAPKIAAEDKTIFVGERFNPLEGVSANDFEDGNITQSIEIIVNEVDVNTPGTYNVTYLVKDSYGAKVKHTVVVTVKPLSNNIVNPNNPMVNNTDDGGPFTTDQCGNVFDRWGNQVWSSANCSIDYRDEYQLVNTVDY